jgi:GNAT superfamily N-acetyltransferase
MFARRLEADNLFRPDGSAHIEAAFVEEQERGKGVGSTLLRHCVAWARESGHKSLTLDFRSFNLLGARFWQGHGFRPVATVLQRRIDHRIAWADGTNV